MKTFTLLLILITIRFTASAQVRIERSGSPDFLLTNTNVMFAGTSSRMFFKTGNYYTGGMATIGTAANTARLSFFTLASGDQNSLLERMTILNNGYVGMATTTPVYPLHVKAAGIGITQEAVSGSAQIGFYTSSTEAYVQTHNSIPLYFATNNGSAQMALTTAGRLGIGTTSPGSKLEVKGKTKIIQQAGEDAALELSGNIKVSGSNPAAFVVWATSPEEIILDHPAANGNPNAIILVTNRRTPGNSYKGSFAVEYVNNISKWRIIPTCPRILDNFYDVSLDRCNGDCFNVEGLLTGEVNLFELDTPWGDPDAFNVLVIGN